MKKLNLISQYSDFHHEGIGLLLFILGFHYIWMWALCVLYIYRFKRYMKLIFFGIPAMMIFTRYAFFVSIDTDDYVNQTVHVVRIEKHQYQSSYTLDVGRYHVLMKSQHDIYEIGDILYIKGEIFPYPKQTVPHGFNSYQYYLSKHVRGYIIPDEVAKVDHRFHILHLRYNMYQKLDGYQSSELLKSFLFGEETFDVEIKKLFSDVGIIYLLQASGLHIFMLISLIKKMMFYLDLKTSHQQMMSFMVYLIFFYLHAFDIGVTRLFIMFILMRVHDHFELRLTKLDLLQFTFFSMLMINIALIYHVGFLITYLILTTIYLLEPLLKDKGVIEKRYIISASIFLVLLPFQGKVSFLTLLCLPIITFIVTGPLFISSMLGLIYPNVDRLNLQLFSYFTKFTQEIDENNLVLFLPALSIFLFMIYYLLLIYFFSLTKFTQYTKRLIMIF
ncbi:MAG: hypothetical protein EP317_02945, partial [Bacillota bacterium]